MTTTTTTTCTAPTVMQTRRPIRSLRMTRSAILANRTLFNTRLEMWNTELKYINARIEEWKGSGQAPNKQHPELRAYLLRALRDNIVFEAKMFSDLRNAFEAIRYRASDRRKINVVLDSMSSGEAVRKHHLAEWKQYEEATNALEDNALTVKETAERMEKEIVKLALMGKNLERLRGDLAGLRSDGGPGDNAVDGVGF